MNPGRRGGGRADRLESESLSSDQLPRMRAGPLPLPKCFYLLHPPGLARKSMSWPSRTLPCVTRKVTFKQSGDCQRDADCTVICEGVPGGVAV